MLTKKQLMFDWEAGDVLYLEDRKGYCGMYCVIKTNIINEHNFRSRIRIFCIETSQIHEEYYDDLRLDFKVIK